MLVDTSAIIDGRIVDVSQTGFINGTLVIPRFVLDELRHIADSTDSLRRNRGRRGLEILTKLRKEAIVPLQVLDVDGWDGMEVDSKLVKLAKSLKVPIVTTDYNLNRVAGIQGVKVLNVNDLANALKPAVIPGEDMEVRVIQEGKEVGQGVAFLDDGPWLLWRAVGAISLPDRGRGDTRSPDLRGPAHLCAAQRTLVCPLLPAPTPEALRATGWGLSLLPPDRVAAWTDRISCSYPSSAGPS